MDEYLLNTAGEARAHDVLRLGLDGAIVDGRQGRWSSRNRPNELLEESHMKHIMQLGTRRQLEANGDGVDELDYAVWPVVSGLQLALGDLGQGGRSAMPKAQEHPITHCIGNGAVQLVVVLLVDGPRLLQAIADVRQELLPVRHAPRDGSHASLTRFIRPDGGGIAAVDHPEGRVPQ